MQCLEEEYDLLSDSKYRYYITCVERILKNFEYSAEWADLISALSKLKKLISSYEQYGNSIPKLTNIAKRLAQCLHPGLPSGVHLKSLETYDLIFSQLSPTIMAKHLFIFSSGIFPCFSYAALNVKTMLLGMYENYYLNLGDALKKAFPGILIGLLDGLEEGSQHYEGVLSLLNKFNQVVGKKFFYDKLWLCVINNSLVRYNALLYVLCQYNKRLAMDDQINIIGYSMNNFVSALICCFYDSNILAQRNAIEFVVYGVPIHSHILLHADMTRLMAAAITILLRRDISLNRRVYSWLLASSRSERSSDQTNYFIHNSREMLTASFEHHINSCLKSFNTIFEKVYLMNAFSNNFLTPLENNPRFNMNTDSEYKLPILSPKTVEKALLPFRIFSVITDHTIIKDNILHHIFLKLTEFLFDWIYLNSILNLKPDTNRFRKLYHNHRYMTIACKSEVNDWNSDTSSIENFDKDVRQYTFDANRKFVNFTTDFHRLLNDEIWGKCVPNLTLICMYTDLWSLNIYKNVVISSFINDLIESGFYRNFDNDWIDLNDATKPLINNFKLIIENIQPKSFIDILINRFNVLLESITNKGYCDESVNSLNVESEGNEISVNSDLTLKSSVYNDNSIIPHYQFDRYNNVIRFTLKFLTSSNDISVLQNLLCYYLKHTIIEISTCIPLLTISNTINIHLLWISVLNSVDIPFYHVLSEKAQEMNEKKKINSQTNNLSTDKLKEITDGETGVELTLCLHLRDCRNVYSSMIESFLCTLIHIEKRVIMTIYKDICSTLSNNIQENYLNYLNWLKLSQNVKSELKNAKNISVEFYFSIGVVTNFYFDLIFRPFKVDYEEGARILELEADFVKNMIELLQFFIVLSLTSEKQKVYLWAIESLLKNIQLVRDSNLPPSVIESLSKFIDEEILGKNYFYLVLETLWSLIRCGGRVKLFKVMVKLNSTFNKNVSILDELILWQLSCDNLHVRIESYYRFVEFWNCFIECCDEDNVHFSCVERSLQYFVNTIVDNQDVCFSIVETWILKCFNTGKKFICHILERMLYNLMDPSYSKMSVFSKNGSVSLKNVYINQLPCHVLVVDDKRIPTAINVKDDKNVDFKKSKSSNVDGVVHDKEVKSTIAMRKKMARTYSDFVLEDMERVENKSKILVDGFGQDSTICGPSMSELQDYMLTCDKTMHSSCTFNKNVSYETLDENRIYQENGQMSRDESKTSHKSDEMWESSHFDISNITDMFEFKTFDAYLQNIGSCSKINSDNENNLQSFILPKFFSAPIKKMYLRHLKLHKIKWSFSHLLFYKNSEIDLVKLTKTLKCVLSILKIDHKLVTRKLSQYPVIDKNNIEINENVFSMLLNDKVSVILSIYKDISFYLESVNSQTNVNLGADKDLKTQQIYFEKWIHQNVKQSLENYTHLNLLLDILLQFLRSFTGKKEPALIDMNCNLKLIISEILILILNGIYELINDNEWDPLSQLLYKSIVETNLATIIVSTYNCCHYQIINSTCHKSDKYNIIRSRGDFLLKSVIKMYKILLKIEFIYCKFSNDSQKDYTISIEGFKPKGVGQDLSNILDCPKLSFLYNLTPLIYRTSFIKCIVNSLGNVNNFDLQVIVLDLFCTSLPYFDKQLGFFSSLIILQILKNVNNYINYMDVTLDKDVGRNEYIMTHILILVKFTRCILKHCFLFEEKDQDDSEIDKIKRCEMHSNKECTFDSIVLNEAQRQIYIIYPSLLWTLIKLWHVCKNDDHEINSPKYKEEISFFIVKILNPMIIHDSSHFIIVVGVIWGELQQCDSHSDMVDYVVTKMSNIQEIVISFLHSDSIFDILDIYKNITSSYKNCLKATYSSSECHLGKVDDAFYQKRKVSLDICLLRFFYHYTTNVTSDNILVRWSYLSKVYKDLSNDLIKPTCLFIFLYSLVDITYRIKNMETALYKDVQEICVKLIEKVNVVISSLLENTTWIRRSLAVKTIVQVDFNEAPEDVNRVPKNKDSYRMRFGIQGIMTLAQTMPKLLDIVYNSDEKEKTTTILTAVLTNIFPFLKVRSYANIPAFRASSYLLANLSEYQFSRKLWKREIFEIFNDSNFFQMNESSFDYWKTIIDNLMSNDSTTFRELLNRPVTNQKSTIPLFVSRDQEIANRCAQIKRISFVVYAADVDQYCRYMPEIQEKVTENLKFQSPLITTQVFHCFRVMLLKFTRHLVSIWPMLIYELTTVLSVLYMLLRSKHDTEIHQQKMKAILRIGGVDLDLKSWNFAFLGAAKLLNLMLHLPVSVLPQFQLYHWAFVDLNHYIGDDASKNNCDFQNIDFQHVENDDDSVSTIFSSYAVAISQMFLKAKKNVDFETHTVQYSNVYSVGEEEFEKNLPKCNAIESVYDLAPFFISIAKPDLKVKEDEFTRDAFPIPQILDDSIYEMIQSYVSGQEFLEMLK